MKIELISKTQEIIGEEVRKIKEIKKHVEKNNIKSS
jgi:hypothetical protein